jgi:hypothetical protein
MASGMEARATAEVVRLGEGCMEWEGEEWVVAEERVAAGWVK